MRRLKRRSRIVSHAKLAKMVDKQYQQVIKEIRGLSSSLADLDLGLAEDREQLGDFNVRLANVETQLEELRKAQRTSAEKTGDQVADAVAPIVEAIQEHTLAIEDKDSKMTIKEPFKLWNYLKRWIKVGDD